jgi:hypothetical protein
VWAPTADGSLYFNKEECLFWGDFTSSVHREPLGSGHKGSKLKDIPKKIPKKVPNYVREALESWRQRGLRKFGQYGKW